MIDQRLRDNIRRRLLHRAGIPSWDGDETEIKNRILNLLIPVVEKMYNRLFFGHMRYGPLAGEHKPHYNQHARMQQLLAEWHRTGNDECLIDLANYCIVEIVEGVHPKKHFHSTDDGTHATLK